MEDISNVSSEEELLQLRNEGKISEDEYEELRSAMRKSAKLDVEPSPAATDKAESKRKLGKIAFCLMLGGIVLGPVCYLFFGCMIFPASRPEHGPWLLLVGLPLEIAAFTMGVVAWPGVLAKATVIAVSLISFIVVLALLLEIVFLGGF